MIIKKHFFKNKYKIIDLLYDDLIDMKTSFKICKDNKQNNFRYKKYTNNFHIINDFIKKIRKKNLDTNRSI